MPSTPVVLSRAVDPAVTGPASVRSLPACSHTSASLTTEPVTPTSRPDTDTPSVPVTASEIVTSPSAPASTVTLPPLAAAPIVMSSSVSPSVAIEMSPTAVRIPPVVLIVVSAIRSID